MGRYYEMLLRQVASGGGAAAFSPDDVSGLLRWYEADTITGLANADPVTTWEDSTGTGDATQVTATNKPSYRTNVLNGKPVVRFDGVDNYLVVGNVIGSAQSWTIFIVFQTTDISTNGAYYVLGTRSGAYGVLIGGASTGQAFGFVENGQIRGDTAMAINTPYVGEIVNNNGSYKTFLNSSTGTTEAGTTSALDSVNIGRRSDGFWYVPADVAAVLIYDSALSDEDRTSVRDYLADKYGVTIS